MKIRLLCREFLFFVTIGTLALSSAGVANGQNTDPDSPWEGADFLARRAQWFLDRTAFPLSEIPLGVRLRALADLDAMVAHEERTRSISAELLGHPVEAPVWKLAGPNPTNVIPGFDVLLPGGGKSAGRVTALVFDPSDKNFDTVYSGTAEGGVWQTTNAGKTWVRLMDQESSLAIGSLAIDASKPNIIYAATGEADAGDSYYGSGILKSEQSGKPGSWTLMGAKYFEGPYGSMEGGTYIGQVAIQPIKGEGPSKVLLAAVSRGNPYAKPPTGDESKAGIYRSDNGGIDWRLVLPGADGTSVLFNPQDGNIAYAALGRFNGNQENGVYRSKDGGMTWTNICGEQGKIGSIFCGKTAGRIVVAISPSNPQVLYVAVATPGGQGIFGFWRTANEGTAWKDLTSVPFYCGTQCSYDNVITVSPLDPDVILVGGSFDEPTDRLGSRTVAISSDAKHEQWFDLSKGANVVGLHADTHAIAFSPDGKKLYVGTDGGVWSTPDVKKSVEGVGWTNLNDSFYLSQFYPGMSINPKNPVLAFGGSQDNGTQRHKTEGLVWDWSICGDGGWTAIDSTTDPVTVYSSCNGGKGKFEFDIEKSVKGGDPGRDNWTVSNEGIGGNTMSIFIPPLVMDPSPGREKYLYFGTQNVWQTKNGADEWTSFSSDFSETAAISAIAVSRIAGSVKKQTIYAGTQNGLVEVCPDTSNCRWAEIINGLPMRYVTQIAISAADPSTACATFGGFSGFNGDKLGHVFTATLANDIKMTKWTDISGTMSEKKLMNIPVNDVVLDPDLKNTIYVATDIGVFYTSDAGKTWQALGTGLPRVAVLSLKLDPNSRTLRAGTHGLSAWDLSVPKAPDGIEFDRQAIDFGDHLTGFTSPPQSIQLKNSGNRTLHLDGMQTTENFEYDTTCGRTLEPGLSCQITLSFYPSDNGRFGGDLIVIDDGVGSPRTVSLSGAGK
jgi:photosystem II stability/assembly factor-like uncharacterized protein